MTLTFANCTIDTDKHLFERDGLAVHLEPQVFDLLLVLAKSQGRLVTKDDLVASVWHGLNVSDATISARINAARVAVGDTGKAQAIIKTVHGRGFQLKADVQETKQPVPSPSNRPRALTQNIQFTRSIETARLAFSKGGDGPPLMRVAHWLSHLELDWNSPVWRPLIEMLESKHTLYRYDQRGTGLSSRDLQHADLDAFVEDLKAVADANNLGQFPIFAASQAVPVAVRFTHKYPERVSGLILYGGFAQGRALRQPSEGDMDEETVLGLIRAGWGKPDSPYVHAFSTLFMPDGSPAQLASFVKMQTETISAQNAATLRQIVDRFDVSDILHEVHAPTLVVHGIGDAVQPVEQGRILASEIPDARYVSLESRNHVPLPETAAWDQMMQEVEAFLEGLSP